MRPPTPDPSVDAQDPDSPDAIVASLTLRSRRRARAMQATAFVSILALIGTSCTRFDVKPAVSVQQVPVDLTFGADRPDLRPPQAAPVPGPQTPPASFPPFKKVTFEDFELPPIEVEPEKPCVLRSTNVEAPAVERINNATLAAEGRYDFTYWGLEEGKKKAVTGRDVRVVDQTAPRTGVQRPATTYRVLDGFTGQWMEFKVQAFDDTRRSDVNRYDPEVGFFLYRVAWPEKLGGSVPKDAEGRPIRYEPLPSLKLLSFPVMPGRTERALGYDPFSRLFFTSRTTVVERDDRIRACDELASAYKVKWDLSVGAIPDFELLLSPLCDPDELLGLLLSAFKTSDTFRTLKLVADLYLKSRPIVYDPVMQVISLLEQSTPDGDEARKMIEDALRPSLVSLCAAKDVAPAFEALRGLDFLMTQTVAGTQWFATQWGGMPIKDDFVLDGDFVSGHFRSNIYSLEPNTD